MEREEALRLAGQCREEEEKYQFEHFTQSDALKLGKELYEHSIGRGPVAIEIRMNHLTVFSFFPNGTNGINRLWLDAKANTVDAAQQSSLGYWAELLVNGKTQEERRMPAEKYAACGGGFPLRIRGTGVIGSICVSGLPHMEDHRLICDTLRDHFS